MQVHDKYSVGKLINADFITILWERSASRVGEVKTRLLFEEAYRIACADYPDLSGSLLIDDHGVRFAFEPDALEDGVKLGLKGGLLAMIHTLQGLI